jgi:hypothetical protein
MIALASSRLLEFDPIVESLPTIQKMPRNTTANSSANYFDVLQHYLDPDLA